MNCRLFVGNEYPVKSPERKYGDSGIDFYMPNFSPEFIEAFTVKNPDTKYDEKAVYVEPGDDVCIPLGVHSLFEPEWELRISNKSGVCTKQKLTVGAEVIDSTYEGVIHAHLFNSGKNLVVIPYGQKLVQGCLEAIDPRPISVENASENNTLEGFYRSHKSSRGEGGFGSTGI